MELPADPSEDRNKLLGFEILIQEHSRMLTTYLRSLLRNEAEVDDLYQETMLVAWRRLDTCDLSRPFGPWLRGIAARLAMAHYRKSKQLPIVMDEQLLAYIDRGFESLDARDGRFWNDRTIAFHECIEALPVRLRDVIQTRYLDEQPVERAASRLQITFEACKKRVQRSRALLAECMKRKGIVAVEGKPS